MKRYITD